MKKLYKLIESGNFDYSKVTNKEEYFEEHIPKLKELGFVSEKFADAIAKRESIYPTGLQTKIYGIALPHVESEYVKKSGIILIPHFLAISSYQVFVLLAHLFLYIQ